MYLYFYKLYIQYTLYEGKSQVFVPYLCHKIVKDRLFFDQSKLGERKIYSLDAYSIAEEELGRAIPNVPMVAALIKIMELMDLEKFRDNIKVALGKKLRPEVVDLNMKTIDRAYKEVKEG